VSLERRKALFRQIAEGKADPDLRLEDVLLPVESVLSMPGVSPREYAAALGSAGLQENALHEIAGLQDAATKLAAVARFDLISEYLAGPSEESNQDRPAPDRFGRWLAQSTHYPSVKSPSSVGPRPSRIELSAPVRIDLAMGGISDLPAWASELPGAAVSLCAKLDGEFPLYASVEGVRDPGVWFEAADAKREESPSSWEELSNLSTPTAISRACLMQLVGPEHSDEDMGRCLSKLFGSGLRIRTSSEIAKGLGSSSILAALVLQGLHRMIGRRNEEIDITHRVIEVERRTGAGGGWEDGLVGFHGGVVKSRSEPGELPRITADRLELPETTMEELGERLVLFSVGRTRASGSVLAEAVVRYLEGKEQVVESGLRLVEIAEEVAEALRVGDLDRFGALLSEQWRIWKTLTSSRCTTERVDSLIAGASPWITGAKVNGAGPGGTVMFLASRGGRDDLLSYLEGQPGSMIPWQPSSDGYQLEEYYDAGKVRSWASKCLPEVMSRASSPERHGRLLGCRVLPVTDEPSSGRLVGPIRPALFETMGHLSITTLCTAAALGRHIGKVEQHHETPAQVKRLIDAIASSVFAEELSTWSEVAKVVISEGKDATGEPQPAIPGVTSGGRRAGLRCAVDVVDGTTLTARGLPGAYSLCGLADGLLGLPDLQAYAFVAPSAVLGKLDLASPPEEALLENLAIIAASLGKELHELSVLTHSEDTGHHHRTLISRMSAAGVRVVVPDPVVVEFPYVLSACLGEADHDVMVGVFGLPEIAIATLVCGVLNRKLGIVFRIASNSMLRSRGQQTLEEVYQFTDAEIEKLAALQLRRKCSYTYQDLVSAGGATIVAAAVTPDPILDTGGIEITGSQVSSEGWLVDPCGNAYRLAGEFQRPNLIDYPARNPIPLFDLSLLIDLQDANDGDLLLERIGRLARAIEDVQPTGIRFQPLRSMPDGEPGLHITLFEFFVDFAPATSPGESAFGDAASHARALIKKLHWPRSFTLAGEIVRYPTGIGLTATLDDELKACLIDLRQALCDHELFRTSTTPQAHHATIARFTEVLSPEALSGIDEAIRAHTESSSTTLTVSGLVLRQATMTPFRQVEKHERI